MDVILNLAVQGVQMVVVLALAPLLTGFVRKVKARLMRRQGPSLIQPYRDLAKLMRKDVVLADNASWLFRAVPYLVFAGTWVAAALVPTFATGLIFSWSADLIAIIALLGSARFFLRSGRHGYRHELRRHRLQPRDDDRVARRAGDDHDRLLAGAGRRLDAALDGGRRTRRGRRLARLARPGAGRAGDGGDRRERHASRSTIRRRISNSPWSTRR